MTASGKRRLKLSPLGDADAMPLFGAIAASRADLRRRLGWSDEVRGPEEARAFIAAASQGERALYGVREIAGEDLVGVATLEGAGPAELSGWVRSDKTGRGYALEAGRLLIAQAFRGGGLRKLYARLDPANRAARKVVRRLGFRYEGCLRRHKRLNGRWVDQECWGLLREEWKR